MRLPWLSRCQTETSAPATGSPEPAFRTKPSILASRVRVTSARSLTHTSVMETTLSFSPNFGSWLAAMK